MWGGQGPIWAVEPYDDDDVDDDDPLYVDWSFTKKLGEVVPFQNLLFLYEVVRTYVDVLCIMSIHECVDVDKMHSTDFGLVLTVLNSRL
jgi:hypothetical protein